MEAIGIPTFRRKNNANPVLILYAQAGQGHKKAAEAIAEACQEEGIATQCLDVLSLTPSFYGRGCERLYLFLIQWLPWVWGLMYYTSDVWFFRWPFFLLRQTLRRLMGRRVKKLLETTKFSVVVSTYFMATTVPAFLRRQASLTAPLITLITDYLGHQSWLEKGVDHYMVARPETKEDLVRRGVASKTVEVLGIPVGKNFRERKSRQESHAELGTDPGVFTALLTNGMIGGKRFKTIIEGLHRLSHPLQILVVCGANRRLYRKLHVLESHIPGLKVFGFVDNMSTLMAAADVLIGKGGGLTISESLASGLPMIVYKPLPGQEFQNAAWLESVQAGYQARSLKDVLDITTHLMQHPSAAREIREAIKVVARPNAAVDIVSLIKRLQTRR